MAYNPNNYYQNPYIQNYSQQFQQQIPQQMQPNNQPYVNGVGQYQPNQQNQPIMQNGLIWVDGINDVNQFPVAPNNTVRLWHKNGRIVYYKTADASGRPFIEAYDLIKRESLDDAEPNKKEQEYALKSDLASFASAVSGINQIVSTLRSDVDAIKGDVYGLAGKKKTAKKTVTEENDDE